MSTHTSGPWTFGFAKTYWHVGGPIDEAGACGYICRIRNSPVAEADARLIASAPDMLAALKSIQRTLAPGNRTFDELMCAAGMADDLARAAIARAEGHS